MMLSVNDGEGGDRLTPEVSPVDILLVWCELGGQQCRPLAEELKEKTDPNQQRVASRQLCCGVHRLHMVN